MYFQELRRILPESFEEYQKVEKKMSLLLFLAIGAEESSAAAEL